MQGFGSVTSRVRLDDFVDRFDAAFKRFETVPYRLLLSMELCASSRLEANTRSRLIMLVSAVEALAEQRDMSDTLGKLIPKLQAVLRDELTIDDDGLRNSLEGQIDRLKRESIRRAIRRMLVRHSVGDAELAAVEKAYDARSAIVHEGKRVPGLDAVANELDFLLLRLYPEYTRN